MEQTEHQPTAQPQAQRRKVRLLLCPQPVGLTEEERQQREEAFIRRQEAARPVRKKEDRK